MRAPLQAGFFLFYFLGVTSSFTTTRIRVCLIAGRVAPLQTGLCRAVAFMLLTLLMPI